MIAALRRFLSRRRKEALLPSEQLLPELLLARMHERRFSVIQGEVQRLVSEQPANLSRLLTAAREQGWSDDELEKLCAWGHYYCGDMSLAFDQAMAHGRNNNAGGSFDSDMFMLAVLCLYHNAQFEEAWSLLASLGENEAAYSGRADFYTVKSSVAYVNNLIEAAWVACEEARRIRPDDAMTLLNAYGLAFRLPDARVFSELRDIIAAKRVAEGSNAFFLSAPALTMDDYAEGFRLFEARYEQPDAHRFINPALLPEKRWRGRMVDWPRGRSLLISCEQGLGDTIQMVRYFPLLTEVTEGALMIEIQPELLALVAGTFTALRFSPRVLGRPPSSDHDYWMGAMSLPYFFSTTAASVPLSSGYLSPASDNLDYWRTRVRELAGGRPRIGISWSGSSHRTDRQRSIPFKQISPWIEATPEFAFFALQTAVPAEHPENLYDLSAELITFSDTAALAEHMDLVITADTAAVHLAGAMGKRAWLLLPYRFEWRWSLEGEHNHWYDSVVVLRQTAHGDWDSLLAEVFERRLAAWLIDRVKLSG